MSDSSEPESLKWFRESFQTENFLFNEITKNVNKIYARLKIGPETIPLDMYAMKKPDGHSQLGVRDVAIMFYGSMTKTIIDTISKNLQADLGPKLLETLERNARIAIKEYAEKNFPLVLQDLKRCDSCGSENEYKNKFCGQCGMKLKE